MTNPLIITSISKLLTHTPGTTEQEEKPKQEAPQAERWDDKKPKF